MKDIFSDFDFSSLDSSDFKEDSVREDLIMPMLKELGYSSQSENKIIRSKSVKHKFVQTGSGKHKLTSVPDYLLEVGGKYAWVLDAKAPNEDIKTGKNVEQTYFYAIHPDIRVSIYALCNGREFIAFDIHGETLIYFALSEIEKHWRKLQDLLSPQAFDKTQKRIEEKKNEVEFDYLSRKPLEEIKKVRKRAARRHFGVHGYFTKQSWDIVHAYIKNFTKPNDVVLDPFGGSGVTVVEALMTNRKGIHIDINPLSILMVKGLIAPVRIDVLQEEFEKLKEKYLATFPNTDDEIEKSLEICKFTATHKLAKGSDVPSVDKLFSKRQKAHLAYLKNLILNVKNKNVRD